MDDSPVTERLRQYRKSVGMTQADFAAIIGKSLSGYQHYENPALYNKRWLPLDVIDPIAKALAARGIDAAPLMALAGVDATRQPPPAGLSDHELLPLQGGGSDRVARAVAAFIGDAPSLQPWVIRGRAMTLAGWLPGDVAIVDHSQTTPTNGAVVVAQIYNWDVIAARTVIRLFEADYLVAQTLSPGYLRPERVDDRAVMIKGVAVGCVRAC